MTLPQSVADALDYIDASGFKGAPTYESSWHTIRAHLLSQEAEIERCDGLRKRNRSRYKKAKREVEWMRERLAERDISLSTEIQIRAESESRLAAANAQLRLMHRVLSQAVCVACADDGTAKDHELDKLEVVLRDQGWIAPVVVPSTHIDAHPQGAGDE